MRKSVVTAKFDQKYFLGSIIAAGATRGTVTLKTNQSWLIPTWLQMVCSCCVCLGVFFLPESPRWLFIHGKEDKAKALLAKYHGEDNPDSLYVSFQLEEFRESLEMDGADRRWWDYRALFKSRRSSYRVLCGAMWLVFTQWTSGGIGLVSFEIC